MTVQNQTSRNDYTANGSTSAFSYAYRITDESQLLVTVANTLVSPVVESTLSLGTDFSVSGVGASAGGTVQLINNSQAWINGSGDLIDDYTITIRRAPLLEQGSSFRDLRTFFPSDVEDALDYLVFQTQSLWDRLRHAPKFRESSTSFDDTQFPDPVALGLLQWNADGDELLCAPLSATTIAYPPATDSAFTGDSVSEALDFVIPLSQPAPGSGTDITLSSNGQIPLRSGADKQTIRCKGNGAAVSGITLPTSGFELGNEAFVLGNDDTDTVEILQGATGTAIPANILLGASSSGSRSSVWHIVFDGTYWREVTRS